MSKRVVTYLSDEQYEILCKMVRDTGDSEADILRYALRGYMQKMEDWWNFEWPTDDPERGGKREGAGRKRKIHEPLKNGGSNA